MAAQLFIGHLSSETKTRDLENVFLRHGKLLRCDIKTGYGFVEYDDPRDAEEAIKRENDRRLLGSRITVEWAKGSLGDKGSDRERDRDRDRDRERDRGYPPRRPPPGGRPSRSSPPPPPRHFSGPSRDHRGHRDRSPVYNSGARNGRDRSPRYSGGTNYRESIRERSPYNSRSRPAPMPRRRSPSPRREKDFNRFDRYDKTRNDRDRYRWR